MNRETLREEVTKFRSASKEDALGNAEKSIRLEKHGEVAVIVLDQLNEKANKLSTPNMLRLFELFTQVEDDKEIRALVFLSKKPTIFIAGADISEISRMAAGEASAEQLMKLQAVFTYLESLPIPSIAAIHGACMGGGTELSLACDYRMATDAPETRIALPEVQLGVLPGWGGTQRMPRLIGLEQSLDLILSGRPVDGKKAKKMGLVDKIVPKENLEEKALAWAREVAKTGKRTQKHHERDLKEKVLETVPGGKWLIFDQAKKTLMKKTKGNYPAPLAALNVIKKTYGGKLEAGLRIEAEAFGRLVVTPESKNLIRVFYLTERVKKDKGVTTGAKGKTVGHAAVVGAGVMGGGIAQLLAAKDVRVRMKDINWDAVTKGYKAAHKVFAKLVTKRKMKPTDLANAMARIEGTTTYSGFKNLDLVIEAVVENLDVKKKVFKDIEAQVSPETVLATNTSSLSVTQIASAIADPKRVVGMHFFNPVDKMPLVEVIRGKESSDEAVATVFAFAKKLGKTPIVVKDAPGFVVNRILGPYLNEAVYLMLEGVSPTRLDSVMEKFGMPMGPAELLDEVGLDVATKVAKVLYGAFGDRMKPPSVFDSITDGGRLGKKSGKGIYLYENGKKTGEDPTLGNKLGISTTAAKADLTDEVIQKRLAYVMVNEAARILEEEVARDAADVDIGMIFGTGFAPFRGGLLRFADSVGAESIVSDLDIFARKYGERFKPSNYLQGLAVGGKKFHGDD